MSDGATCHYCHKAKCECSPFHFSTEIVCKNCARFVEEIGQLQAENRRLRDELDLWRPLTKEEAQKAYDEAEAVPLSPERIGEIIEKATDPAERLPNSEQAQLVAKIRKLRAALKPFARWAEVRDQNRRECHLSVLSNSVSMITATVTQSGLPTMGDCRAAREALGEA